MPPVEEFEDRHPTVGEERAPVGVAHKRHEFDPRAPGRGSPRAGVPVVLSATSHRVHLPGAPTRVDTPPPRPAPSPDFSPAGVCRGSVPFAPVVSPRGAFRGVSGGGFRAGNGQACPGKGVSDAGFGAVRRFFGAPAACRSAEAACKTVVGRRMKCTGMRWSVAGANPVLWVRCAHLSGWFDDYWHDRLRLAA